VAKKRGIDKMMAYVRGDNKPMIAIFEQAQFKRKFTGDPSDVELVLDVASLL
jgi:ribosomal protein S18 acetylase RimI-like enzyme